MSEWPKQENKLEQMPEVVLHFMRHSTKEKAPEKEDKDVLLSAPGRELAAGKFEEPMDMRFAHTMGSPRVRTHETVAVAATKNPEANPEDLGIGKMRITEKLDFILDEKSQYGAKFHEVFNAGTALPWLINESDQLAKETGDTYQSTYSRMAGNIAGLIYKTYLAASRGAKILEQSQNEGNETNNFERILGTHGTLPESFLLKLVDKMHGAEARDKLLKTIGTGFGVTEGFDVKLSKKDGQEQIRITYKKGEYTFDEIVPATTLEEIIKEGEA